MKTNNNKKKYQKLLSKNFGNYPLHVSCTWKLHLQVQEQFFISWVQVFCEGDMEDMLAIHSLLRMRNG